MDEGVLKGVSNGTVRKLLKAGYLTIESLAVTPVKEVSEKASIGEDTTGRAIAYLSGIIGFWALLHVPPQEMSNISEGGYSSGG